MVPSTPKKRKLSDAAHPPSTPPSARSAKSDSPYRKRVGGSASVVKAMPTLETRVCTALSCSLLSLRRIKVVEPLPYGYRTCLLDTAIDRLNVAVNFSRPDSAYYSISKLPTVLSWGPGNGTSVSTDESRFIIQAGVKVRVLILGEVTKAFLRGTAKNRGSCSLNVTPLFKADADRLENLVKGLSTSSKGVSRLGLVYSLSHSCLAKAAPSEISTTGIMVSNSIGVVSDFPWPRAYAVTLSIASQASR